MVHRGYIFVLISVKRNADYESSKQKLENKQMRYWLIEGEEYIKSNGGKMLLKDQEKVTKIQKQLLWDMVGPATKAELKRELFDPLIEDKANSKLIKDRLKHLLKNYKIKD